MKEKFINLLKSTNREGIDNLIDWLENKTDFFTAPASTKYHLAKEEGLLEHSLNVYEELKHEYGYGSEVEYIPSTIKIVALLHDICKANFYKTSSRNIKNEQGKWEQVPYYITDDQFPIGHGEKSVILIQKFIDLKLEEIYAIRWHMGGFETKENYNYISNVFNKCNLALMLHIADLKATYIKEKE